MNPHEIIRAGNLIDEIIKKIKLDLTGLNVLTECGSGYFALTPIIALMAGAKRVLVWSRDSQYGTAEANKENCKSIISTLNLDSGKVVFALNERPAEHISSADIITNLGFVRPLDSEFLSHVKRNAVIPLMSELWEFRSEDIDLEICKAKEIKIAGTWENHPNLKIFDACGFLATKLCFEAGIEIYQNKICIWSDDDFGKTIFKTFEKLSPASLALTTDINEIKDSEIIFIADYLGQKEIAGANGIIPMSVLQNKLVIHLCGEIDFNFFERNNIQIYPYQSGSFHRMTRTLAHLGMKPVIDLHTAGLKVGELLLKNENNELVQKLNYI